MIVKLKEYECVQVSQSQRYRQNNNGVGKEGLETSRIPSHRNADCGQSLLAVRERRVDKGENRGEVHRQVCLHEQRED